MYIRNIEILFLRLCISKRTKEFWAKHVILRIPLLWKNSTKEREISFVSLSTKVNNQPFLKQDRLQTFWSGYFLDVMSLLLSSICSYSKMIMGTKQCTYLYINSPVYQYYLFYLSLCRFLYLFFFAKEISFIILFSEKRRDNSLTSFKSEWKR